MVLSHDLLCLDDDVFGVTRLQLAYNIRRDNYKDDEQMSENSLRIVRNDGSRS